MKNNYNSIIQVMDYYQTSGSNVGKGIAVGQSNENIYGEILKCVLWFK